MNKNTPEYISWLLTTNNRAVERAILCLYNRQTADEQATQTTKHCNGRGFNSGDARKGTYMAKWILTGNHLSGEWLIEAKMMAFKYLGQLVEEATYNLEQQEAAVSKIMSEIAEEKAILTMEAEECSRDQ